MSAQKTTFINERVQQQLLFIRERRLFHLQQTEFFVTNVDILKQRVGQLPNNMQMKMICQINGADPTATVIILDA
jgi:hypothetical protein